MVEGFYELSVPAVLASYPDDGEIADRNELVECSFQTMALNSIESTNRHRTWPRPYTVFYKNFNHST